MEDDNRPINFSVPTGNFGDVYAGYLAKKMGLPINKLIVATNQNDILYRAISNGGYEVENVFETLSPSMDIQVASNFERLLYDLNEGDDLQTIDAMKNIKEKGKYIVNQEKLDKINANFSSSFRKFVISFAFFITSLIFSSFESIALTGFLCSLAYSFSSKLSLLA